MLTSKAYCDSPTYLYQMAILNQITELGEGRFIKDYCSSKKSGFVCSVLELSHFNLAQYILFKVIQTMEKKINSGRAALI